MGGMQLVTINPMYTAPELEYAINKVDIKERIYTIHFHSDIILKTSFFLNIRSRSKSKALICPQSIGPLDYRATLNRMLPGLEENSQAELNYANVPTLKRLIMFNMEEEITNVTNFDTLFNAGGSAEKAILDQTIIE